MSGHESDLEQTALLAAGFLNERDASAAREHLRTCAICAQEYRQLADVAASIGLEAQIEGSAHELRLARVKKRLLHEVSHANAHFQDPLTRSAQAATQRKIFAYQTLAAVACVAAVFAGFYAYSMHQRADIADNTFGILRAQLTDSQQSETRERTAAEALLLKQRRLYALDRGALVVQKSKMLLALSLLPSLPRDHVFQVWTQKKGEKKVQPDRTFTAQSGQPTVVELSTPPNNIESVAVSIEPYGGSSQPTTKPILVQKID